MTYASRAVSGKMENYLFSGAYVVAYIAQGKYMGRKLTKRPRHAKHIVQYKVFNEEEEAAPIYSCYKWKN